MGLRSIFRQIEAHIVKKRVYDGSEDFIRDHKPTPECQGLVDNLNANVKAEHDPNTRSTKRQPNPPG
jgi:hypothetical protein